MSSGNPEWQIFWNIPEIAQGSDGEPPEGSLPPAQIYIVDEPVD